MPNQTTLVPQTPRSNTPFIGNGEIWDIAAIGNRVFIAGSFTTIKNQTGNLTTYNQRYVASYNIDTGLVDANFKPTFDGTVTAIEASPDGTKLFVAGTFNTVSGVAEHKVASINPTTGAAVTSFNFAGTTNNQATALAATNSTLYVGGRFTKLNNASMSGLAAVNAATGVVDPSFQNPITGGIGVGGALTVQQLKLTHDETKLLVVHTGRQIAGQDRYGAGLIDTGTKQLLPWETNLWQDNLQYIGGIQRAYAADIAPNDQFFVVTAGSGGDRPPISDTAVALPIAGGADTKPIWVSRHFDSVYSVAITEKAVYLGGHFNWEPSPTSPDPWPGLDNVGYGTGQGLSGYGLGDAVVRRNHLGALDPATGKALEWDPGSNSYQGNKAMLATSRGLFVGGDGKTQGGVNTGRVAFYDLNTLPAATQPDTTIKDPIEGRVEPAGTTFTIDGTATTAATTTVKKVQVTIQDTGSKQYLQSNGTWGTKAYNFLPALGAPAASSTTWSMTAVLDGSRTININAKTQGANGVTDATKALKHIESFNFADATPNTAITAPPSGSVIASTTFTASGTATDDHGISALRYWFQDDSGLYLQSDGSAAPEVHTFTGLPDVVGATSATWQYTVTLPHEGNWKMSATAIDTAGQADLRDDERSWLIDSSAQAPSVSISTPATMIPPTASPVVTLAPGAPVTFSGSATDYKQLSNVEVILANSTTRENLGSDGTWSTNTALGWYRIAKNLTGTSYNWSWTTPFNLKPGRYTFRVHATNSDGLITGNSNLGLLTLNVQVPGDNPPHTTLTTTGTIIGATTRHLDLSGTATDDFGVSQVQVSLKNGDNGLYLQPDGTLGAAYATRTATLAAPGTTSSSWTLPIDLPSNGTYTVTAFAIDSANQQDQSTTAATAKYLVYPGDALPTLDPALQLPTDGTAFTESRIVVSGRGQDDVSMADVQIAVIDSLGRYMSSSGAFTSTTPSWRSSFLTSPGSAGSNYSYTSPVVPSGAYTVQVRAVDNHGQVTATPTVVHVTVSAPPGNQPPVAHATVNCSGTNHCTFDARTSTDEDAPTLTYAWNFGNGRTATGAVPSIYFTSAATYTVTLTATDQYGATGTTTLSVPITAPVGNHAPTAVLNPPACSGVVCNFSAVGSTDPDLGDAISYSWNFADGSPLVTSSATSHTFPGVGPYTVTLTVTDGWGASTTVTRSAP